MKKLFLLCLFFTLGQAETIRADVKAVSVDGSEGAYHFSVTLKSTETGCAQYANWWEILNKKGALLYRRILIHSHPNTQPFTRSGGKVKIGKDDMVYVRAHMNKEGYVGDVFVGSVSKGFGRLKDPVTFKANIEKQEPLPSGCLY